MHDFIQPQNPRRLSRQRRGAMLYLILIMLLAFMAAVAFSVDLAYMQLARTELRSATDAAAKAAAIELSASQDVNAAIDRGQEIAARNIVGGVPLRLIPSEFSFGRSVESNSGKFVFNSTGRPTNSVKVDSTKAEGSLSGAVPLFFGNFLGVETFEPISTATATFIERDIVLVVDRSGSMQGRKFASLVAAIVTFVTTLDATSVEEKVGLASYEEFASEDVQLTADLSEISAGIRALDLGGWTSISRGMIAGDNIMSRSRNADFVERTMIVMTDGNHNRGQEPAVVARRLAAKNVTIHTITFGSGADIRRMKEVARIGGGKHYHAVSGPQLVEIYREIALTLSTVMTQ